MAEDVLRRIMATHILNFDARRDRAGRLCLAPDGRLPALAGRVPAAAAARVAALIAEGAFLKAEAAAVEAVARYTDKMAGVAREAGVEFLLRDICWQAGPKGANETVLRALGLPGDGVLDEAARVALRGAEHAPGPLLQALTAARDARGAAEAKRAAQGLRIAQGLSPRRYAGDVYAVAAE